MRLTVFLLLGAYGIFAPRAFGLPSVNVHLNGTTRVKVATQRHYRHSLDCYPEGKGVEHVAFPDQILPLEGNLQSLQTSGVLAWRSSLSDPFPRNIRTLNLTTGIAATNDTSIVSFKLLDSYRYEKAQYTSNDCNHWDGISAPSNASVSGMLDIVYTVPNGVWLLEIKRSPYSGIFNDNASTSIIGSVQAPSLPLKNRTEYIWVEPNSTIHLQVSIPEQVNGNFELMDATFSITALGDQAVSLLDLIKLTTEITKRKPTEEQILRLLGMSLSLTRNPEAFKSLFKKLDLREASLLSENLFTIANSVIAHPQLGLPVKTSAAISAFNIAMSILGDLAVFCREVSVHLPFSNRDVRTSGLRAASFWLNRSVMVAKNYSFADFESLFDELSMMQSNNFTYAQVMADKGLKAKIKTAFELIDRNIDMSHSPIISALNAVNKTIKSVGSLGASQTDTTQLLDRLNELRKIEDTFFQRYDQLGDAFRSTNQDKINVVPVLETLAQLKNGQAEIIYKMEGTIKLLSLGTNEDTDSLFTRLTSLLSHQVNIVERPNPTIPYFENIRRAYIKSQNFEPIIQTSRNCVLGDNL